MPLQNRVTPFGELFTTTSRGTLMGNRGCLHDAQRRIRRPYACRRWITCVLEFRGRHRTVMAPGRYTELFFLDEATALAAGHRPCAECQHARYLLFRDAWAEANPGLAPSSPPRADEMDRVLHRERLEGRRRKRTYAARVSDLPPGVMVADAAGVPWLVLEDCLLSWDAGGYGRSMPKPAGVEMQVLTPASIVKAISGGYPVFVHSSALISPSRTAGEPRTP